MPNDDLVSKIKLLSTRMGGVCHDLKEQADATDSAFATYRNTTVPGLISDAKLEVKNDILGGAGEAYDTLKEIEDLLKSNDSLIAALQALKVVHFDAQTLTTAEQEQARTNIGAASAADVTSLGDGAVQYTAQTKTDTEKGIARTNIGAASQADLTALTTRVGTAETDIDNLETALGDLTDTDFVSVFNAAYTPSAQSGD